MRHDLLADALSVINNAEKSGKSTCTVKPTSQLVRKVFDLLKREGYIKGYDYADNKRGGVMTIHLAGRLNGVGAIKPRFSTKTLEMEKYEKRYLPSKDFGFLIISTPKGLLTHLEAQDKKMGGKLIAYVY